MIFTILVLLSPTYWLKGQHPSGNTAIFGV